MNTTPMHIELDLTWLARQPVQPNHDASTPREMVLANFHRFITSNGWATEGISWGHRFDHGQAALDKAYGLWVARNYP
jgi:hypothetical protein